MPAQSSNLGSHFSLQGVWALGLALPRLNGTMLWQKDFLFLRVARPGTATDTRASAYPLAFDMVWAEPQPFGSRIADRVNQSEASRQNDSTSAGWKPLQENPSVGQGEKTSANEKVGKIRAEANLSNADIGHPALVSTPQFMQPAVFLLTERMRFIPKDQPVFIDFAQARKSFLPQALGFTSVPAGLEKSGHSTSANAAASDTTRNLPLNRKGYNKSVEEELVSGEARVFSEVIPLNRKNSGQLTGTSNFPGESQSTSWLKPSTFSARAHALMPHLPHAMPLVTLLTKVVEDTVDQRMQQLVRKEHTVGNEQVFCRDSTRELHLSPISEDGSFHRVFSEENIRSLMSKLQELAREDRFRMGL